VAKKCVYRSCFGLWLEASCLACAACDQPIRSTGLKQHVMPKTEPPNNLVIVSAQRVLCIMHRGVKEARTLVGIVIQARTLLDARGLENPKTQF